MRCRYSVAWLVVGLSSFLAFGQIGATTGASSAQNQMTVGPDDPVITIDGFCSEPAAVQGSACKTVITRAEFEKMVEALQPGMPLSLRLKVANAYARNMRMASAAEARGLDKTPEFEEEMRFGRMQLLAQDLDRALKSDASNISDADIEKYYEKNKSSFEQATVQRIFVPHSRRDAPQTNGGEEKKSAAEVMIEVANELRARATRGEDMDKLQVEAYERAGVEPSNPDTKVEKVRRETLPPQHEPVMELKPGEVSEVFSDPDGGHFIYKMIVKETMTLDEAKPGIRTAISTQRYSDSMKVFQGDVVFSDAYFNPPRRSPILPERKRRERTDTPAGPHD